jgi:hypothetical protein
MLDALRTRKWWRPESLVARVALPTIGLVFASSMLFGQPGQPQPSSPAGDPLGGSSPHKKINRQIDLFERIIDDVLIDSDYALVQSGRNAIGAYLPGYGATFAFEFSLVGPDYWGLRLGKHSHRWSGRDLDIFFFDDDDDDWDDDDDDRESARKRRLRRLEDDDWDDDDDDDYRSSRKDRTKVRKYLTRQYHRVKKELIETLGDYGDIIDGNAADEWVTLIARPMDRPWGEEKITSLVIRARQRDLAERAADRIDDDALFSRVVIEEYK